MSVNQESNKVRKFYIPLDAELVEHLCDLNDLAERLRNLAERVEQLNRAGFVLADEDDDPHAITVAGANKCLAEDLGLWEREDEDDVDDE
jgi:hypothetical protein